MRQLATLPALAFEGATKRNKPNLAVRHSSACFSHFALMRCLLRLSLSDCMDVDVCCGFVAVLLSSTRSSTAASSTCIETWSPS